MKFDEVGVFVGSDEEEASSESTALVEVNVGDLNKESLKIINQIIAEADADKAKDLTYLFNLNQNKKTMVRVDKLSNLQDILVSQLSRRIAERPDEISNQELMQGIKVVQDIIERGQKQISGAEHAPLIQINQQTNNIGGQSATDLSRESRNKAKNAVQSILDSIAAAQACEAEVIEAEEPITEAVAEDAPILEGDEDDD